MSKNIEFNWQYLKIEQKLQSKSRYSEWLMQVMILLSFQTVEISYFKQISNFLLSFFGDKQQSKKKREGNDKNSCLIGFLRGQFLLSSVNI